MKSYNHLFEKVIDRENLKTAMRNAAKKKGRGRKRKKDIQSVMADMDGEAEAIAEMLKNRTYAIPHHEPCLITDGVRHKERYIIKPYYRYEQIVHHAIIQVLQPVFMRGMYEYCVGSVPKRGDAKAKKYIEKYIRENPKDVKYWLKMDIRHFFQSVNHRILKEKLRRVIHDRNMMWLLELHIDAYRDHEENGEEYGLPLGYYTSQWFANFYLQDLDHFIKEKLGAPCYARYMDDMAVCGANKKELHKMRSAIAEYLKNELDMDMKGDWQVFRFDYTAKDGRRRGRDLDYMGWRFYRDKTTLRRTTMLKATRKAAAISKKDKPTWYDASQMLSALGKFPHADAYGCYEEYIKDCIDVKKLKKAVSRHDTAADRRYRNGKGKMESGAVNKCA